MTKLFTCLKDLSSLTLNIEISSDEQLVIRSVTENQIEFLRSWKNEYRHNFFFREIITSEMQQAWYKYKYLDNPNEILFIIFVIRSGFLDPLPFGCIGFKQYSRHEFELFNIINGSKQELKKGYMRASLNELIANLLQLQPNSTFYLDVLLANPALHWYRKIGFKELHRNDSYARLILNILPS